MALSSDSDIGIFVARNGFTRDEAYHIDRFGTSFDLWTEYYDRIPEEIAGSCRVGSYTTSNPISDSRKKGSTWKYSG